MWSEWIRMWNSLFVHIHTRKSRNPFAKEKWNPDIFMWLVRSTRYPTRYKYIASTHPSERRREANFRWRRDTIPLPRFSTRSVLLFCFSVYKTRPKYNWQAEDAWNYTRTMHVDDSSISYLWEKPSSCWTHAVCSKWMMVTYITLHTNRIAGLSIHLIPFHKKLATFSQTFSHLWWLTTMTCVSLWLWLCQITHKVNSLLVETRRTNFHFHGFSFELGCWIFEAFGWLSYEGL